MRLLGTGPAEQSILYSIRLYIQRVLATFASGGDGCLWDCGPHAKCGCGVCVAGLKADCTLSRAGRCPQCVGLQQQLVAALECSVGTAVVAQIFLWLGWQRVKKRKLRSVAGWLMLAVAAATLYCGIGR
jgi:hypothetical protein